MDKYIPEKLIRISRYQKYFPRLSEDIQKGVLERMRQLIEEERQYCDKGNYKHMAQILSSIAIYEVLQRHGFMITISSHCLITSLITSVGRKSEVSLSIF